MPIAHIANGEAGLSVRNKPNLVIDGVNNGIVVLDSGNITLAGAGTYIYTYAHGLGRIPKHCLAVFVCLAADAAFNTAVGDEMSSTCVFPNSGNPGRVGLSIYTTSTNIILTTIVPFVGNETAFLIMPNQLSAPSGPTSWAHFALKFYYF
jgi:hypothetical protein